MRELKFRAWNNSLHMMVPDFCVVTNRGSVPTIVPGKNISDWDYVPMQYTGLKDMNGVEIYEGDILSQFGHEARVMPVVEYHEAAFKIINYKRRQALTEQVAVTYEVIGNIYENPELVEKAS